MKIELTVNGRTETLEVAPDSRLIDALRNQLGLFSVRAGCDVGYCGACTVVLDGEIYSSCLLLAAQVDGSTLTTVEGLAGENSLHPAQQAFVDEVGYQCAFCTPGFILSAVTLVENSTSPLSDEEVQEGMAGNLCRCGSYVNILKAVKAYRDSR